MKRVLATVLMLSSLPTLAADERARIAAERRETEARYAQELAQCQARFAVTACQDEVKARRREALSALRAQELVLDDAERKRRAVDRMRQIERKRIEAESRPVAPADAQPVLRSRAASEPQAPPHAAPASRPDHSGEEAAEAARRAAAADRVREQAAQDRAKIDERQRERVKSGKSSAPLPVPPELAPSGPRR